MRIAPARSFRGRFTLPGDKSISHRAALLGAMAQGDTSIRNFSTAADCASTLACLRSLGVEVEEEGAAVRVRGRGLEAWRPHDGPLDAGNSGSTLRMLAGALAGRPFRTVLTGDASLRRRPVERVAAPLRRMGARLETSGGRPPLTVEGGRLVGIEASLDVASAQVKTAVLLAGLQAAGVTTVREPAASRDHTERMLPLFGAAVEREGAAATVRGPTRLTGASLDVPGDVSSAAFLVVAALVRPDSEVRLDGLLLNPTRTAFLDVLREMGADLDVELARSAPEPVGTIIARSSRLHGVSVDPARVAALIDELPALAVAAAFAQGTLTVSGAAELRVKESDRIAAITEGLSRLGARVEERPDGFVVHGGPRLNGARLRSQGDHRIAMALAVAALGAEGDSVIEEAGCVDVSFPGFFDLLARGTGRTAVPLPSRIVLVGFMGSGKSTVGALVAEALGWEFVDMDGLIEARAGRPVARIFEADGEAAFREAERGVAQSLGSRERLVVAAGGGAFAEAATRQALQHQALTVWLKCDLETVLERIPADGRRPLARNREIMRGLLAQREASYRLADLAVEAGGGPPRAVAEAVIAALRDRGLLRET